MYQSNEPITGIFKRRINRFISEVYINNELEIAYIANTGRMEELLLTGAKVILIEKNKKDRKTKYDLSMVYKNNTLVSIDSRLPNLLLEKALGKGDITYFKGYKSIRREVRYGKSRFDILLEDGKQAALIEAKSVTLVKENNIAFFPDAPTKRGKKHIHQLIKARQEGYRTAIFFIIQREDAVAFMPNKKMDPEFADALILAKKRGVEIYAYNCKLSENFVCLNNEVEVLI